MNEPISLKYYNSLSEEQKNIIFRNWKQQEIIIYNSNPDLLDNDDLNRATGRTTRLIDYYIQELYNNPNKEIEIIDHYDNIKAHIHLTQMILQRLYAEHPRDKFKIVSQNILEYVR